jgi:hypothetical protein
MKNLKMSFTLCLIAFFFASNLSAQNFWIGGTPGNETNWNTAKNWSKNQVPDWTENVIIPNVATLSGFFPVIDQVIEAIPHIEIQSNAVLTVLPYGKLVIDGISTYNSGIFLYGKLIATGEIDIANVAKMEIEQRDGELYLRKGVWAGY